MPHSSTTKAFLTLFTIGVCAFAQTLKPVAMPNPAPAGSLQPNWALAADGSALLSWVEPTKSDTYTLRYAARQGAAWGEAHTIAAGRNIWRHPAEIPGLMAKLQPQVWLGVGLAAGRTALSIEAVALNLADWPASDADADGVSVARRPIAPDGPAAHLTTLPAEPILQAWHEAGIPGYLSPTAGSYLCNFSFYTAAQAAATLGLPCMVGFLHVPLLPELVSQPDRQPSMAMALQAAGLDCVIEACRTAAPGGIYVGRTP